ncbi:Cell division cycle protein 20-like protein [Hypsibius exemplaris]|uniref:Cell division cycle protein 20-like protein n=1 Tax=Hypsibius exemplaris TaxID=2072580 RepID=A0A1W0XCI2_HYPEX|nr:Cell division cycle protein 20-like protein [Hypsibius exemplaris]
MSGQLRKSANSSSTSLLGNNSNNGSFVVDGKKTPKGSHAAPAKPKTPRLGKSPGPQVHDRYIMKRASSVNNLNASTAALSLKGSLDDSVFHDGDASPRTVENRKNLSQALLGGVGEKKDGRILEFRSRPPPAPEGFANPFSSLYTHSVGKSGALNAKKIPRAIPTAPSRILDAPDLLNDFYLTRVDWGSNNLLAVALGASLYLWNGETAEIEELYNSNPENLAVERYVSGVSWLKGGNFLAVGNSDSEVQIWDVEAKRKVRTMKGHSARIGCLDWNDHILASGCRSGEIHYHDVRVAEYYFCSLKAHAQEVCGLKWSPDKRYLASGGNDNVLNIWPAPGDCRQENKFDRPEVSFNLHQAAVKAVAWCPWQPSVLASGGGTADRTIKLWNVQMGSLITSKDTGSQVSGIVWSEDYRELVTGHGYSKNELILWKYPSFDRAAELTGHQERILDLCQSPDGSTVVSTSADETIRLWSMFPVDLERKKKEERDKTKATTGVLARQCIR